MIPTNIRSIPYKKQRYDTCGDYFINTKGEAEFRINDMSDERAEFIVLFHEMVEAFLCRYRMVDWKDVDKFDIAFEKNRKRGDKREPGDQKEAPYYKEHKFATKIEKMICKEFGLEWSTYEKIVGRSCK